MLLMTLKYYSNAFALIIVILFYIYMEIYIELLCGRDFYLA